MTSNQDFLAFAAAFAVSDAMTAEMGDRYNIKRFKHWTQSTYYTKVLAAVTKAREAELVEEAREADKDARKAEMAARAVERADFDAWLKPISADRDHADYKLLVAVRRAKASDENWNKEKADFLKRLEQDPTYAFSWAGNVVEAAADRAVSLWLLNGFEAGCTLEVLTAEAMRETLRFAKKGNGRSTSIMSNLTDDVTGLAWAKCFERLSGETFW